MNAGDFRRTLRRGYSVFRGRRLLEAAALGTAVLLPALLLGIGLGMIWRYQPLGGWIVPALAAAGLVGAAWIALRFGLRHRFDFLQFLRHLERRMGLGENELVLAEEMDRRRREMDDPLSRGLADLTVRRGEEAVQGFSFRKLAPALSLRRPGLAIVGSAVLLTALFALWPRAFSSAASRLAAPGTYDLPPSQTLRVEPGDVTVERGSSLQVKAVAERILPKETPRLLYRPQGAAWKSVPMSLVSSQYNDSSAAFRGTLRSVLDPLEYAVATETGTSEVYRIRVVEPLRASGYQTSVEFPQYTGLAPIRETRADANLSALIGSQASLTVLPTRPGAEGWLVGAAGDSIRLERLDSGGLHTAFRVTESMDFTVALRIEEPVAGEWASSRYRLEAVADRMPTLFQVNPEQNATLPPDMKVTLDADCLDDFGLSRLDLVYRRNDGEPQTIRLSQWNGAREARVLIPWSLESIALVPGDIIHYRLELTDNDAVTGPKTTVGPECTIRFPTFDEMYAAVQEDRLDQMADAQEALEQQQELQEDLLQIEQELKQTKQMSWEQQEQLKDVAERQQKVRESVEQLARSMEQSLDKMEQASLFTPEMLEKVQQINDLVKQIESPEFHASMEKLQEAIRNLDRRSVDQALDELKVSQQEIQRSLDRTLEMLKQLKREEALDSLIRQAERLMEEQRRLNDQLAANQQQGEMRNDGERPEGERQDGERKDGGEESDKDAAQQDKDSKQGDGSEQDQESKDGQKEGDKSRSGEEVKQSGDSKKPGQESQDLSPEEAARLQEKQEALREELKKLQEQMEELRKEAEENWQALKEQMEQKQAEKHLGTASENMKSASQSMGQCNNRNALKFGRNAEEEMNQFAQSMRSAQQEMRGGDQEELTKNLYRLSGQLVQLSKEQEDLMRTAPARPTRDLAVEQMNLGSVARRTLDELYELGRQSQFITPELGRAMGEAVRHLQQSRESFELGDRGGGMTEAGSASEALDGTVLAMLNANQNACNSSCSSGSSNPLSRLRSLGGQQETLNQDMQQMMGQMQGERLSSSGAAGSQIMEMAARQEAIRRGLREVEQSVGERSDVLGRLGDIGKDMEEVIREMRQQDVDERVLERQQRILSRLLTAQRSLRKQGEKEERISRTGYNPEDRSRPAALQYEEPWQESLRRGILRGSQDPVPGEYRRLVDRYFRSLGGSQ